MAGTTARERVTTTIATPGEIERVSPHDLWGWLSTFDHDAQVCPGMWSHCCVFATYWSSRFGGNHFVVGMVEVQWPDGYAEMPDWTRRYQLAVFASRCNDFDASLTAGNLLAILGPFLTEAQMARAGCD